MMMSTRDAEELIAVGDPQGALELLQRQVREHAADAKLRVFLFQLLCVLGQWQRASTQLEVCGELDAATLPMVNTYREALKCELVREAVFAGKTTPIAFGQPQAWVAWLVEALQAQARGDAAGAARLRAEAFEAAPATSGTLNGEAFEWIADADSRLGPVCEVIANGQYYWLPFESCSGISLEKPTDMRDLVWLPAEIMLPNEGRVPALIPTRYVDTEKSTAPNADQLKLASATEWIEKSEGAWFGVGQRLWTTDQNDYPLLDVRLITSMAPPAPARVAETATS